ncbi:hypothetical protein LXM60_24760 [Pandoraea sputorum]|uniref:hypothetical protein n=1 Tax=Pandoraea sputorum TaxID=93222 RepID=UPI001E40209A|nr:hypothetical protein [Pandoraea sputorum]MCE4063419.1 hypothetical protein [Pandoraea sputorum]
MSHFLGFAMPSLLMIHPTKSERRVKTGFNWAALLFGSLWAYAEGLVRRGGRLIAVDCAAGLLWSLGHPTAMLAGSGLFLAKNIVVARSGGAWLQQHLVDQGYRTAV